MIYTEFNIFLAFILIGLIIGFLFDFFRILLRTYKTPDFITIIEDIVFWLVSGIILLLGIFILNEGKIRAYLFLGLFLGIIVYTMIFSRGVVKIGTKILIGIVILVILGGIGGVGYTLTIGKWQKNAEREVFKDSVAYTEQAASFLAKSYKEYSDAETDADKKTIMEYVIMRYPNLDTDSIDNSTLRQLYIKCLNN